MNNERKEELLIIAEEQAHDILQSWWREIGSWDGLLEDEILTMEELEWIWNKIAVMVTIKEI